MRNWRLLVLAAVSTAAISCSREAAPPPADLAEQLRNHRLIDLTYSFDSDTVYWPTGKWFEHERVAWGRESGHWYSSYNYAANEHGGTHLDAPIHFSEGKIGVAEIPLDRLVGPGVVIDITEACAADRDYVLSAADVEKHEREHGAVPAGAVVLVKTGWSGFWPNVKNYLGDDVKGDASNLSFPGISPAAARILAERKIALIGIDTASIDPGNSQDFPTHQVFAEAEISALENVARLEELPPRGSVVMAMPMKIGEGSGAPCRIAAWIPVLRL